MNSNTFLNRIEILMYSSLISVMSGLSNLRAHFQQATDLVGQPTVIREVLPVIPRVQTKESSLSMSLISIREALLPLLLWIILGFAAGFLIGMIHPA